MGGNQLIHRSGISTVVGTLFFLVVMIGGFVAFTTMMETNNDIFRTQLNIANKEILRIQEDYVLSVCTNSDDSNRLKVFIENTGDTPIEMTDLFIINKTETTHNVAHYEIKFDDSFVPVGKIVNILENQELTMEATPNTYDIKVMSALGNTEILELPVADPSTRDNRLQAIVWTDPPQIANTANSTVFMEVFNRGNHTLYDVTPYNNTVDTFGLNAWTVTPSSVTVVNKTYPLPHNITQLNPNESITFKWEFEIFGGVGTDIDFTGSAKGKLCHDTVTYDVRSPEVVGELEINQDAVLGTVGPSEPFAKPRIFTSFPSPAGQSDNENSFWGVVVTNPTNQTLTVFQVAIHMIVPGNDVIFDAVDQTNSIPTSGWTNPSANVFLWSSTTGIEVTEFQPLGWRVALQGAPVVDDSPANVLAIDVHSDFGRFTAPIKTFLADSSNAPFANIFHCDHMPNNADDNNAATTERTTNYLCPTTNNDPTTAGNRRLYNITGVAGDETHRFNVTLENSGSSTIDTSTKLITWIPAGFLNINTCDMEATSQFVQIDTSACTATNRNLATGVDKLIFNDGSTELKIQLDETLSNDERATFSFTATPPGTEEKHMYLIFHLLSGESQSGAVSSGSLTEVVVQTCGQRTGCN